MDLIRRTETYIRRESMITENDQVLAGVSGGADSVCLLLVLKALEAALGFTLTAVHVHHGIRERAGEDLAYTRDLCRSLEIPCRTAFVRADLYAGEKGMSLEEACRELRYQAFFSLADELEDKTGRPCRVAVAHHLEDQAETVLFHLCRGSALTGLRGMLPVTGRVIRPLLPVRRDEIEAFLKERGTAWQTDETNLDTGPARNFLRTRVLPLLRDHTNSETDAHIAAAAREAAETEAFLADLTAGALAACREEDGSLSIPRLLQEPPLLRRRILLEAAAAACGGRKDLTGTHVQSLEALLTGGGSRKISLPGGVPARKVYDRLVLGPEDPFPYPETEDAWQVRLVTAGTEAAQGAENQYTKVFDYDKIASPLVFRTRQQGDRMALGRAPEGPSKSLARLMIDEKIPKAFRDRMVLPFSAQDCLWVPGVRISPAFMPDPGTKRYLLISWAGEKS